MFVLLALVLVVGLLVAGVAGLGPLAFGRRPEHDSVLGGAGPVTLGAVAVVAVLVVAFALVGVAGLRGGSDDAGTPSTTVAPGSATASTTNTVAGRPVEGSGDDEAVGVPGTPSSALGPVVRLRAAKADPTTFPAHYEAVGEIRPDTVLQMRVTGFDELVTARARQCVAAARIECGNAIPVQFDKEGEAAFQYLVTTGFAPAAAEGQCRAGAPRCSIVVENVDGEGRAEIQTVFVDPLPVAGRARVVPSTGLADGETVTVTVAGFPPGAIAQVLLCAAPADAGARRCSAIGAAGGLAVGPDGTATTEVTIRAGEVGTERVFCGRGRACGVSVVSNVLFAPAPVVVLGFAAPPGADYDAGRLALGLALTALLLAIGFVLLRRTDWSPIGEEAAPEIDEAEYADLDAIVAALPPEEEDDEALAGSRRS